MRKAVAVIAGAVLGTGCFVDVSRVADPEPTFRKARAEAEALAGRQGPARSVQILVYDPEERELVRVSLPLWVARRLEKEVDWDDVDLGHEGGEEVKRALRGRLTLRELERAALGTLIEVEEESGEQVLVWLR